MSTSLRQVFGTGFMLAMLLAAFASFAQDASDDDELMPARYAKKERSEDVITALY